MSDKTCPRCGKSFPTKFNFNRHLRRKIPCEPKVDQSDEVAQSPESLLQIVPAANMTPMVEEPEEPLNIVPLEDFNWKSLRQYGTNFQQYEKRKMDIGEGGNVEVTEVTVTKYMIRANEARKLIPFRVLLNTVHALNFTSADDREITDRVFTLLSGVHVGSEQRLHSICIGDMSRQTVRLYSRPPPNDTAYWQCNSKEVGLRKLQAHSRNLFKFLIEASLLALVPATHKQTGELVLVLQQSTSQANTLQECAIVAQLAPDDVIDDNNIVVYGAPLEDVDLIATSPESAALLKLVEERKDKLLRAIERNVIHDDNLQEFLVQSHDTCVGAYRATKGQ